MNDCHISSFARSAELMADAAGKLIREAAKHPLETEIKSDGSPVTDVDKATEDCIRAIIAERHPSHGIIGEEHEPLFPDAELVWVIDPIDGTRSFIRGLPLFASLIALLHKGEPVMGIISLPALGETAWAVKGEGAYSGKKRLKVSKHTSLKGSFIATT